MVVRNFPGTGDVSHGEDFFCSTRLFKLFAPLWVSLEVCDRFKACG